MRARHYDPTIGRFVSEDPKGDGNNWFAYCGNDPVNRVDETGNTEMKFSQALFVVAWTLVFIGLLMLHQAVTTPHLVGTSIVFYDLSLLAAGMVGMGIVAGTILFGPLALLGMALNTLIGAKDNVKQIKDFMKFIKDISASMSKTWGTQKLAQVVLGYTMVLYGMNLSVEAELYRLSGD
jgi:hypothetical protein